MKVFVAGNSLVKEDGLALNVARKLRKRVRGVEFEEISSLGELEEIPEELVLMDVAKGIERTQKITSLERLEKLKLLSLHDLDIATELMLYSKLGKLKKVVIIAIPKEQGLESAVNETARLIKGLKT